MPEGTRGLDEPAIVFEEAARDLPPASEMGCWSVDLGTMHGSCDERMREMLGLPWERVQFPMSAVDARIHQADLERVRATMYDAALRDRPFVNEYRTIDGARWIRCIGRTGIRDPDGSPRRLVGVAWDVTDRRGASAAVSGAEAERRVTGGMEAVLSMIEAGGEGDGGEGGALACRVRALISAQHHEGQPRDVGEILERQLRPWTMVGRAELLLEETAVLGPERASALALIVGELASATAGHGALRRSDGHLSVRLSGSSEVASLFWDETVSDGAAPWDVSGAAPYAVLSGPAMEVLEGRISQRLDERGLFLTLRFPR